jgi:hypothetical protein
MPRFGTLDVDAALASAPEVPSFDAPSWELPDVQLLQVNWEVDDEAALRLTPPSLHPSIPPYASFVAARYPVSPVGPFTLAQVRLVVRAGIRPRALALGAVCDSEAAAAALREHWGYPVQHGDVVYTTRHDRIGARAAVDGRELLDIAIHDPDVIGGSDLMTFDNVHLVRVGPSGEGTILQIDPEYAIHQANRGRPTVRLPDPEALGMQGLLKLRTPIVGFAIRADTDLVPVRFRMDPSKPAIEGTTKIQRAA